MIKAVIFDLDGTLINTIADIAKAINISLQIYGYETYDISSFNKFIGDGILKLCERVLPVDARTTENIIKIKEEFFKQYEKCCTEKTIPYVGIDRLIETLKDNGYYQAVASNKPDFFTKKIVSHFFKDEYFSVVLGQTEIREKKPSPQIIFDIAKELKVELDEIVFVGDSDVDIKTAQNAGVVSIGCEWGFRGANELKTAGANYLVSEPIEIYNIIKTL